MTVKQLIELLNNCAKDLEVVKLDDETGSTAKIYHVYIFDVRNSFDKNKPITKKVILE